MCRNVEEQKYLHARKYIDVLALHIAIDRTNASSSSDCLANDHGFNLLKNDE